MKFTRKSAILFVGFVTLMLIPHNLLGCEFCKAASSKPRAANSLANAPAYDSSSVNAGGRYAEAPAAAPKAKDTFLQNMKFESEESAPPPSQRGTFNMEPARDSTYGASSNVGETSESSESSTEGSGE